MALASDETLRAVMGFGKRSDPVTVIASAVLPTSTPASPSTATVPADAVGATFRITYTAAAGASSGGGAAFYFYVSDGTTTFQVQSPIASDGFGISDGPLVDAGATLNFFLPPIPVSGWSTVGIKAQENADAVHPGTLAASVVFTS